MNIRKLIDQMIAENEAAKVAWSDYECDISIDTLKAFRERITKLIEEGRFEIIKHGRTCDDPCDAVRHLLDELMEDSE